MFTELINQTASPKKKVLNESVDEDKIKGAARTEQETETSLKEGMVDVIQVKDLALKKAVEYCRLLSKEEQIKVVSRIFEHSIDDGLKVVETLRLTSSDVARIITAPEFYLKHSEDALKVATIGLSQAKGKPERQAAKKLLTHFAELGQAVEAGREITKPKKYGQEREIIQELDRAYEPFLSTKKIEIIGEKDPRSSGERLGEKNIELIKTTLEKNYYSGDVLKILFAEIKKTDGDRISKLVKEHFGSSAGLREKYKHTGLEAYVRNLERGKENAREIVLEELRARLPLAIIDRLEWDSFVSQDDLDKIKETFNLTEAAAQKFATVRYQPLDLTFNRQNDQAQKNLIKEIQSLGGQLRIDEQGDFSLANKRESEKSKYLSEEKILDKLEELMALGVYRNLIARNFAGLDSDRAWKMREELMDSGVSRSLIAQGLAGLDSERAWKMRDRLIASGEVNIDFIVLSLAGLDSDRAWKMREEFMASDKTSKAVIVLSLVSLDSDRAWKIRDELMASNKAEKVDRDSIAESLAGLDSDRAWKMREKLMASGAIDENSIALSLTSLDSDRAWKMREELMASGEINKGFIAVSLAGLDSDRAWKMREEFIVLGVDKGSIAKGLAGLDSDRAWKMREEFMTSGVSKGSIAHGLAGDYLTFVWQLKNKKDKQGQNQSPELSRKLHLLNILHTLRPDLGKFEIEKNKTEVVESRPPLFTEEEAVVLMQKFTEMGEELAATQVAVATNHKDTYRRLIKNNIYNSDFVTIANRLGDTELLDSAREVMDQCLKMEEFFRAGDLALALKDKETVKKIIKKLSVRTNLRDAIKVGFLAVSIGDTKLVNYCFDDDFLPASGKMTGAMLLDIYDIAIKTKNKDIISKALTMQRSPEEYSPSNDEIYHREEEFRMGLLSIAIKADDSALRIAQSLESEKDYEEAAKIFIALGDIAQARRIISQLRQDDNFASIAVITEFYYSEEGNRDDINDSKSSSSIETTGGIEKNARYFSEEEMKDLMQKCLKAKYFSSAAEIMVALDDRESAQNLIQECLKNDWLTSVADIIVALAAKDLESAKNIIFSQNIIQECLAGRCLYAAADMAVIIADNNPELAKDVMEKCLVEKGYLACAGRIEVALNDLESAKNIMYKYLEENNFISAVEVAVALAGKDPEFSQNIIFFESIIEGCFEHNLETAAADMAVAVASKNPELAKGAMEKCLATGYLGAAGKIMIALNDRESAQNILYKLLKNDRVIAAAEIAAALYSKNKNVFTSNRIIQSSGGQKDSDFDAEKLLVEINNYLEQESKIAKKKPKTLGDKLKKELQTSRAFVRSVNSVIKDSPEIFLNMLAARKSSRRGVGKLAAKVFPSILEKDQETWRGFSGYSGFESNTLNFGREPSPEDYLNPDSLLDSLAGGDPEKEYQEEVLKFREPLHELVVTGIFGKYNGSAWDSRYQFSVADISSEKTKDITITLPHVGQQTKLPKPVSGTIIKERVKAIKKGKELACETEFSPLGEGTVKDTKRAEEIIYSVRQNEIPREMRNVTASEYAIYKKQFVREYGDIMLTPLAELPEETDLFIESIKNKDPKEQVMAIENFVRQVSYYDKKNREVSPLKTGASLEDRFSIMESRVDELREKNKISLEGKKYAGVCADFAMLTSALLRKAGFPSGVLTGFMPNGKTATIANAHSTAFVLWPTARGGNEVFSVDGTPSGIEGISGASIVEKEKMRSEAIGSIVQDANKKLEEIMNIVKSNDLAAIKKLTNGDLETVVNTILKYETTGEDLFALQNVLDAYWYTPFSSSNMGSSKVKKEFEKFFEKELKTTSSSEVVNPGSQVFDLANKFIQKFEVKNGSESPEKAVRLFEQVIEATGQKLTIQERKVYIAIATYLKAKKMKGNEQ
ncbi:MAG: transglutaminase domain-containing protein [Patescibacteria group bacterium]